MTADENGWSFVRDYLNKGLLAGGHAIQSKSVHINKDYSATSKTMRRVLIEQYQPKKDCKSSKIGFRLLKDIHS